MHIADATFLSHGQARRISGNVTMVNWAVPQDSFEILRRMVLAQGRATREWRIRHGKNRRSVGQQRFGGGRTGNPIALSSHLLQAAQTYVNKHVLCPGVTNDRRFSES